LLEKAALFEIESYDLKDEYIEELKKRSKEVSVVCYDKNNKSFFIYDEDANIIKEALEERLRSNSKEIKGRTAYPGIIKGIAKIVNSIEDMKKVNEGDIIISIMTRPELVPAMKKAAGIVTDEGGITCHAAVISRELKIPCIVGTQVVTQIIKDNNLIEMDANKGVVRKLD